MTLARGRTRSQPTAGGVSRGPAAGIGSTTPTARARPVWVRRS